ncbi:unnamed protein product, partial [Onchocerca flexuosa]
QSYGGEGRGSHCSGSIKIPLRSSISIQKRTSRTSLGGQLFLCIVGSLLSFSICVWLTAFSQDIRWRRLLFAAGAALCSLLFAILAARTMRKAKQSSSETTIPNLAARRSLVKISRKSMCESNLNQEVSGHNNQEESTSSQQRLNSIPKEGNGSAIATVEEIPSLVLNV